MTPFKQLEKSAARGDQLLKSLRALSSGITAGNPAAETKALLAQHVGYAGRRSDSTASLRRSVAAMMRGRRSPGGLFSITEKLPTDRSFGQIAAEELSDLRNPAWKTIDSWPMEGFKTDGPERLSKFVAALSKRQSSGRTVFPKQTRGGDTRKPGVLSRVAKGYDSSFDGAQPSD